MYVKPEVRLSRFADMVKVNHYQYIGIDPVYKVYMFNRDTHFMHHHVMPVVFDCDFLYTQDGILSIKERILAEKEYLQSFTEDTKSEDAVEFVAQLLLPNYGKSYSYEDICRIQEDDVKTTVDYFRNNTQFNVSMAIDIAKGFIIDADDRDIVQLYGAPNIVYGSNKTIYDIIRDIDDYRDADDGIFSFVYDMYMNDCWLRND